MLAEQVTDVEYDVPDDEVPEETCPYCDRPFASEELAIYHIGVEHPEECTEAELEAFEDEREDEEFELMTFHVKITVAVFMTYFLFSFVYASVWAE